MDAALGVGPDEGDRVALSRLGRAHAAYGNPGLTGIAGVLAVGVASVAISLWAVAGYV